MAIEDILTCKLDVFKQAGMKETHRRVRWIAKIGEDKIEDLYNIPLILNEVDSASFEGYDVLIAFMNVLLTNYWIERSWISDVSLFDGTIPQSVLMC